MFMLYDAYDRVEFGNAALYSCLINDFGIIQNEGIIVCLSNGHELKVYFVPVLWLGENLALHQPMGLVESFSANFLLQVFKTPQNRLRFLTSDENVALRYEEN